MTTERHPGLAASIPQIPRIPPKPPSFADVRTPPGVVVIDPMGGPGGGWRTKRFRRNDPLVHVGDPADALLVIRSGRVASRYESPQGDQALIGLRGPGAFIAAYAVTGTVKRHPATVVALEETVVDWMSAADYKALAIARPIMLWELATVLTDEAHRFGEQITEAYWERAEVRVRRHVYEVAALAWESGPGPVSVSLTHEHIAAMAGVTRPTASTAIRSAVNAGVFGWSRGQLIVDELDRVKQWAS